MRVLITGALTPLGNTLIKSLNSQGITTITAVDDLTNTITLPDLTELKITDYMSISGFRTALKHDNDSSFDRHPEIIFHLYGYTVPNAERDAVIDKVFTFGKEILHYCQSHRVRLIYASSVSGYREWIARNYSQDKDKRREQRESIPVDVHGFSTQLLEAHVAQYPAQQFGTQVVGLRVFDVYGPGDESIASASYPYQVYHRMKRALEYRISGSRNGYEPEAQQRDFVYVDDVVKVVVWSLQHLGIGGVFDVGSGKTETFSGVLKAVEAAYGGLGRTGLMGIFQYDGMETVFHSCRAADLTRLREVGFDGEMRGVAAGVNDYVEWLETTRI
ncbi:hypothetical protein BJY04DRAFT_229872 [Aspergillus karnatakaensis]|uniref:uncharacterized protein n=1 Tax=Aspergillus karnatakaensis TaxID=1810916 RepID=UPI003CCCCDB0